MNKYLIVLLSCSSLLLAARAQTSRFQGLQNQLAAEGTYRFYSKADSLLAKRKLLYRALLTKAPAVAGVSSTVAAVTQLSSAPAELSKFYNPNNPLAKSPYDFYDGQPQYAGFGSIVRANTGNSTFPGYQASRIEACFEGDTVCLALESTSSKNFRVLAAPDNGTLQYIGTGSTPTVFNTDNGLYVQLIFPQFGRYKVAVEREQQSGVQGLYVRPSSSAWRPYDRHMLAMVVGDSYTQCTGTTFRPKAWEYVMGNALGWDIWADGQGGSGYANPGVNNKTFSDTARLRYLTFNQYDVVVIAGGINDAGSTYVPRVQDSALAYFKKVRQYQPNALVVVLGAWAGTTGPSTGTNSISDVETKIQTAFNLWNDANSVFIPVSTASQPWIYGTGKVSAPVANGNSSIYIGGLDGTDGTHPNDLGHWFLGTRAADAIRGALQSIAL